MNAFVSYEDAEDYEFGSLGSPLAPTGAHLKWLERTTRDMAEDYDAVFSRLSTTAGRVQESGHEIEAAWKEFLIAWLPPQYEVATRKYIVGEVDSGESPEETDIVVIRPSYPRALRGKTHILAGGVAAAFSVKSTLRASAIQEAAKSSARLKRTLAQREGTPRKELTSPFPYGLLAHSHEWKAMNATPLVNVSKRLFEADQQHAPHPRDSLDLVCIPDLGTWNHIMSVDPAMPLLPDLPSEWPAADRQAMATMLSTTRIRTSFVLNPAREEGQVFASFLMSLYARLAPHDRDLKSLADSFSYMGTDSGGRDKSRLWDAGDVFTASVQGLPSNRWDPFTFGPEFATTYGWHIPW